jgi:tetratricopeptide (TPR) repeat protein
MAPRGPLVVNQAEIEQGDIDGALALLKQAERTFRELGNREGLSNALGNQALIRRDRGDLDRALALHKEEERICRELGNPEKLSESLANQAGILKDQGDLDGALALFKEQERICHESVDLAGLAIALTNQAVVLSGLGRPQEAKASADEATRLVNEHGLIDTAERITPALSALGLWEAKARLKDGDLSGAADLAEEVVVRQQAAGAGLEVMEEGLEALLDLGVALRVEGQLDRSRELMQRVLDVRIQIQGEDHPDTIDSMHNLAGVLFAQGDLAGVIALERRRLRSRRRSLGPDHPDSLEPLRVLATLLADEGDLDAARSLMEESLEAHQRVLGVDAPETEQAQRDLARLAYEQEDFNRLNALLGIEGDPLHWSRLLDLGDVAGARGELEPLLTKHQRVLGDDHPQTLELAEILKKLPGPRRRFWRRGT